MSADKVRVQYRPLSALKSASRNPKAHDTEQIQASLRRFGFIAPVILDGRSGQLVAGHGRAEALRRMRAAGEPPPARVVDRDDDWHIPVLVGAAFASEREAEAYLVADNQLTIGPGWNEAALVPLLTDLSATLVEGEPAPLDGLGFADEELISLGLMLEPEAAPDPEPGVVPTIARPGDVWDLGDGRALACGDQADPALLAKMLGGREVYAEVLDPPFRMDYGSISIAPTARLLYVWGEGARVLQFLARHVRASGEKSATARFGVHTMCWTGQARGQKNEYLPCTTYETVYVLRRDDADTTLRRDVLGSCGLRLTEDGRHFALQDGLGHRSGAITEDKGARAFEAAMIYVPLGALVLDRFAGSGSSLIAAHRHGCPWVGFEIDPARCDYILARWSTAGREHRRI